MSRQSGALQPDANFLQKSETSTNDMEYISIHSDPSLHIAFDTSPEQQKPTKAYLYHKRRSSFCCC